MIDRPLLTAEEFLDTRFDLPESGQWAELESGKVMLFQPPDLDYGNTVLNLSKLLAHYIQTSLHGYACFDLGLLMQTAPDTIRYPAACYFLTGTRFAETDQAYTFRIPELVMEVVSTADRQQVSPQRTKDYLSWGVHTVWLISPATQQVTAVDHSGTTVYEEADLLHIPALLPGFDCKVRHLFTEPEWWSAKPPLN